MKKLDVFRGELNFGKSQLFNLRSEGASAAFSQVRPQNDTFVMSQPNVRRGVEQNDCIVHERKTFLNVLNLVCSVVIALATTMRIAHAQLVVFVQIALSFGLLTSVAVFAQAVLNLTQIVYLAWLMLLWVILLQPLAVPLRQSRGLG